MAKPLELVLEIKGKQAKSFIAKMSNPPNNPARDKTIARAKAMKKRLLPLL
jgi:hypothetical protein